jgi:hypothetical protein
LAWGEKNVDRKIMQFAAILCLVAIVSFSAWPLWKRVSLKRANAALEARTRALVEKHPELKPAWNIAMQDGVLTQDEAKEIVEAAGEKLDREQ